MNRISSFAFIIFILTATLQSRAQDQHSKYIENYRNLTSQLMHTYGIPSSVMLGIAIIESGSGTSALARKFHNHFGIVGRNYNAMKKLGYRTKYKEYTSDTASYIHFCEVLKKKPFYDTLQGRLEPRPWIKALRKSGYAAAPSWEKHVLTLIRRYNLQELDKYMPDPLNEPETPSSSTK